MGKKILKSKHNTKIAVMNFILFATASAFFFALTFFLRKQAGKYVPVSTAYFIETAMQMVLMSLAFLLFSPEAKGGFEIKSFQGYTFAALAGITVVVGVALSYLSLKLGLLSNYQAITSPAQIIFALLIGVLFASESFTLKQFFGIIISIGGIMLIILK